MRIERLEIAAIGPYADREVIDFEELNDAGVCLLTGPTGAGKSTILDAITFALYGTVPRANRGEELVSDLRSIETKPEVVLEATVGGKALRVTRSPAHERPAQRGDGTTNQGQTVLVEELVRGEWEQRSDRWSEANTFLEDLIGMTDDQFSQVVLLPQGRFAKFLNADPTDRHQLLNTLFPGVELDSLETWFENRSRADANARDEKEGEIRNCLTRIEPVLGRLRESNPELPLLPESVLESGPVIEWIEVVQGHLTARRTRTGQIRAASQTVAQACEKALRDAEAKREKVTRRRECERTLAGLHAKAGWRTGLEDELGRGRRAALVVDRIAAAQELAAKIGTQEVECDRAKKAMEQLGLDPGLSSDELVALDTDVTGRLSSITDFEQEFLSGLSELLSERKRLEEEASSLEGGTSPELLQARSDHRTAETGLRKTKEHLIEIRDLRTRGMAAELADQLEGGVPCMVCGSTDHPSPATPEEHSADREDEERATEAVETAEEALEGFRVRLEEATTRLEARKAEVRSQTEATKEKIKAIEAREKELKGDQPTLAARRDLLDRERTAIRGLTKAIGDLGVTREQLAEASEAAERALGENEFETGEQALAAFRKEEELDALEASIREHDKKLNETEGLLQGELADVDPGEEVEIETVRQAAIESADERDRDLKELQQAEADENDFGANAGRVPDLYEELAPLHEAAKRSGELFHQTSGRAGKKLRLSTFVLAERLKNVIRAANHHLTAMSSGKYEIRFDASSTGRKGSAGLGLVIYDFHSSKERKSSTLSGGETFYTSLALALGLAEVVQAESGGRPLETLFIDEGFGSLDADTLDQVMDVIDSLRDGGRTVGLVSHVEEMKSRIPTRIVIDSSPEGSSLKVESGV